MAITGYTRTLTLRLRNTTTGLLTGQAKPNLPGDSDYIPREYKPDVCVVTTTLTCPIVKAALVDLDGIFFELSLPSSVIANPQFKKLEVILRDSGANIVGTYTYTDFSVNYFSNIFTPLGPDSYTIDLVYKNNLDTLIHSCTVVTVVEVTSGGIFTKQFSSQFV